MSSKRKVKKQVKKPVKKHAVVTQKHVLKPKSKQVKQSKPNVFHQNKMFFEAQDGASTAELMKTYGCTRYMVNKILKDKAQEYEPFLSESSTANTPEKSVTRRGRKAPIPESSEESESSESLFESSELEDSSESDLF